MKPIFKALTPVTSGAEWITGHYYRSLHCDFISIESEGATSVLVNPKSLCQQTHLTIKNKPLFINDVIRAIEENEHGGPDHYKLLFAVWVEEWSMVALLAEWEILDYEDNGVTNLDEPMFWSYPVAQEQFDNGNFTIIGNIYDKTGGAHEWINEFD